MDVHARIILPLTLPSTAAGPPPIDVAALFLHLLLFDTVILRSARLYDVAAIATSIGIDQTIDLLDSGCVKIRAEVDAIASPNLNQKGVLKLVGLYSPHPDNILSTHLKSLQGIGPHRDVKRLKREVVRHWIRPTPHGEHLNPPIRDAIAEAASRSPVFMKAVEMKLQREGVQGMCARDDLEIEQVDPATIRFRTKNLGAIDEAEVIRGAVSALANLNNAFGQMRRDHALMTLSDDSVALMETKLYHLWLASNPGALTNQFHRVVTASGLPDFDSAVRDKGIDIDSFLRVRTSDECIQFRDFLHRAGTITDLELQELVGNLRRRMGDVVKAPIGKVLRLLITTAAGLVVAGPVGAAAGFALGGIDSFIVEKIFPSRGPVSFISREYPSIFKE